jgi:hypothetical protein
MCVSNTCKTLPGLICYPAFRSKTPLADSSPSQGLAGSRHHAIGATFMTVSLTTWRPWSTSQAAYLLNSDHSAMSGLPSARTTLKAPHTAPPVSTNPRGRNLARAHVRARSTCLRRCRIPAQFLWYLFLLSRGLAGFPSLLDPQWARCRDAVTDSEHLPRPSQTYGIHSAPATRSPETAAGHVVHANRSRQTHPCLFQIGGPFLSRGFQSFPNAFFAPALGDG